MGISGLLAKHSPIRTASSVAVQVGACFLPPLRVGRCHDRPTPDPKLTFLVSLSCAASGVTPNVAFAGGIARSEKLPDDHIASCSAKVDSCHYSTCTHVPILS
jgi:hypothetical protein